MIAEEKYNPEASWALEKVLYDEENGMGRMDAVIQARDRGAVGILIQNLLSKYSDPFPKDYLTSYTSATIHCLRILVVDDSESREKLLRIAKDMPRIKEAILKLAGLEIAPQNPNKTHEGIKDAATHITRKLEWKI